MNAIKVTLYEISGYVLPGLFPFVGILLIMTMLNHGQCHILLSPAAIGISVVASYFLGHFSQGISNLRSAKIESCAISASDNLNLARKNLNIDPTTSNDSAFKIIMNVAQSQKHNDQMDTYLEREGFYRGSSIGAFILFLIAFTTIFGPSFVFTTDAIILKFSAIHKILATCMLLLMSIVYSKRYRRFLEYRVNVMIDAIAKST